MTCRILVAPPFAIHVVMQRMNTKIMSKCSITCNEITNLPEISPAHVQSKQHNTRLIASLSLMISSSSSEWRRTELLPELCDD
jgi:hypothetical protein